jgi:uncharacterized membrane protein
MWHYVQNGQACGPIDTTALQALFQRGSLSLESLVWQQGMAGWVPARTVAAFASSAASSAAPPPIPPLSLPPKVPTTPMDPEKFDIEHNKVFAVLAYVGILFLVPLLAAPRSRFARYHTNQGIILFVSFLIVWFCLFVLLAIPFVNIIMIPAWTVLPVAGFVFMIIGIIHAASGEYKPLPWIGRFQLLTQL